MNAIPSPHRLALGTNKLGSKPLEKHWGKESQVSYFVPVAIKQICHKENRLQLTVRHSWAHMVEKHLPRKIARIGQY